MEHKRKTKTVSFRIASDFEEKLRTRAAAVGLSLNAFVISSLRTSLEYADLCKQSAFMPITGKTLASLMEHLSEEQLRLTVRESVLPQVTELTHVLCGATDLGALMHLANMFTKSGFSWFTSITESRRNQEVCFIARHGLGVKFSFFIGEIVKGYLEICGLQVRYEATENFVKIVFDQNQACLSTSEVSFLGSNSKSPQFI